MGRAGPVGLWRRFVVLALIAATGGCGALKEARDEIIGVRPAIERCFENRDHVTPAWIPIPHLACRGGTKRADRPEAPPSQRWLPAWLGLG